MFEWFCSIRALRGSRKPLPVLRKHDKSSCHVRSKETGLGADKIHASNGWFYRWRWRFNVTKSVRLHGEAADVDLDASEQEMGRLRAELGKYQPDNVFNIDESGLFYRAIPVVLLKEAWDSIAPSAIAGCWVHTRCLPIINNTELSSDIWEYYKKVELELIHSMCSMLSKLSLTNPDVGAVLGDLGLNIVSHAAQKVHDKATTMLLEWLHIEDTGMIDASDEWEQSDNLEMNEGSVDNVELLQEALPLLQRLHAIGLKLVILV